MTKAEIKKVSSDEENISKRSVYYELYIDGKFSHSYDDINDAIEARDIINR